MKKLLFVSSVLFAALLLTHQRANAQQQIWRDITQDQLPQNDEYRTVHPKKFRALELNVSALKKFLSKAPMEFSPEAKSSPVILSIPMPDGEMQRFSVVEYSMQEPALAAKFPEIKTYSGTSLDEARTTIKFDWTYSGFHAIILKPGQYPIQIDPYVKNSTHYYLSYSVLDKPYIPFEEQMDDMEKNVQQATMQYAAKSKVGVCLGDTLRTYKIAVACTGEYAVKVCQPAAASKPTTHAAIVTSVNRVNAVYQNELAVRFTLVAKNDTIEFLNPTTDPFTGNSNSSTLIGESQTVVNGFIGAGNYDIGHTFSTGAGGRASLGVVCDNARKARGVTGRANPTSDTFDVGFVAHEIGHQFNANHTWNGQGAPSCTAGEYSQPSAVEPGSGVTIMSYQGLCNATNNLEPHILNLPVFHAFSLDEMGNYIKGAGNACPVKTATGNDIPVVDAGQDVAIPVSTPFTLAGTATDNHALVYSWEEMDPGAAQADWNSGSKPFFRSFAPSAGGNTRTFPKPGPAVKGETLPGTAQTLTFRLTARDNRAGGGGMCSENITVTIVAGVFRVTSQAATPTNWTANGVNTATITWDRGTTNNAPISCDSVQIYFSADSGLTFPTFLGNFPNNGTANILIPSVATTKGKVKVKGKGKVFFSLNTGLITINICPTPSVSIKASDTSTCVGKKITFTVISGANLTATPVYQWKKNGNNVGSGGNTYVDSTLANGDSVWVVVTSTAACAITGLNSNKIKIKVRTKTLIAITCPIGGGGGGGPIPKAAAPLFCPGDTFRVTATPAGGTWASQTNAATVNNTGLVTVVNGGTATITYTINDSACGSNTATCVVPVQNKPNVPSIGYASGTTNPQTGAGGGNNFCNGKTFTLVGTPSGGTWSSSNTAVFTVTSGGLVTTVGTGTATLTYKVGTGNCSNQRSITGTVVTCASRGVNIQAGNSKNGLETFTVYPNPASSFVNVYADKLSGEGTVTITDLYGKQLKQQKLASGNNRIDFAGLTKGYYLISITTANEKRTEKLIVE